MDEIKRLKSTSNMGYKMAVDLATWCVVAALFMATHVRLLSDTRALPEGTPS